MLNGRVRLPDALVSGEKRPTYLPNSTNPAKPTSAVLEAGRELLLSSLQNLLRYLIVRDDTHCRHRYGCLHDAAYPQG